MPVTRSGYDTTAQAPARERSKITAAAKGTVLWFRDFTSLVFFTGVPNPGFTLWNVSLVLTRYVCYAFYLLLITGMIQSLQAEDTGLSNIIDKLVRTQPTAELHHRAKREIHLLEIKPMDAEKMISKLAGLPVLATSTEVPATTSPSPPGPPTPATETSSPPGSSTPETSPPTLPATSGSPTSEIPTRASTTTPAKPATYRISWCVEVSNLSLELTTLTCSSSFMEPLLVVLVVCMASAGAGYVCGHGHSHKRQSVSARSRRKERGEETGNLGGAA